VSGNTGILGSGTIVIIDAGGSLTVVD